MYAVKHALKNFEVSTKCPSLLSDQKQQIVQFHAALIHNVVMACNNRALLPHLEPILEMSAKTVGIPWWQ